MATVRKTIKNLSLSLVACVEKTDQFAEQVIVIVTCVEEKMTNLLKR